MPFPHQFNIIERDKVRGVGIKHTAKRIVQGLPFWNIDCGTSAIEVGCDIYDIN